MAAKVREQEIIQRVQTELHGTAYEPLELKALSGGNANYLFHARLARPLPDGTEEVAIKHGEGFSASNSSFELSTVRCSVEAQCLQNVSAMPPVTNATCSVQTPKVFESNVNGLNQVMEYVTNGTNLKSYALEFFASPTPESLKTQCFEIGQGLGTWLRSFHDWANLPEHSSFRQIVSSNQELQRLRHLVNYGAIVRMVDHFPLVLKDSQQLLRQVQQVTAAELQDETKLRPIHGDFWTGNVVLPLESIKLASPIPLRITDWEMAQLGVLPVDLGQMIAELYELKLFKDIEAGVWMIQGFISGYGNIDEDFAFRCLLQVGTHLICWGGTVAGWGTPEQVENVVRAGRDILENAWQKNRKWFDGHDLECLFSWPAK